MQTLKFKTNIKCSGCLAKVNDPLNRVLGENNWSVDLTVAEKTLTIHSENPNPDEIESAVKSVGFTIEEE